MCVDRGLIEGPLPRGRACATTKCRRGRKSGRTQRRRERRRAKQVLVSRAEPDDGLTGFQHRKKAYGTWRSRIKRREGREARLTCEQVKDRKARRGPSHRRAGEWKVKEGREEKRRRKSVSVLRGIPNWPKTRKNKKWEVEAEEGTMKEGEDDDRPPKRLSGLTPAGRFFFCLLSPQSELSSNLSRSLRPLPLLLRLGVDHEISPFQSRPLFSPPAMPPR